MMSNGSGGSSREQTYRVSDLDGCDVVTTKGESIGKLVDVLPTRGNDVFVVRNGSEEILIPALKDVILQIDIEKKKILVDLPHGLRDEV